ncbi:hypothetical protein F4777DRAFT_159798 [Nemania sp. FL0916]|nr:hypothetical protein F4777DRAFT_159798 [Nemania sp. FL0916]
MQGAAMTWDSADGSGGSRLPGFANSGLPTNTTPFIEYIDLDSDSPEPDIQPEHDAVTCKNAVLIVFPNICPDYLEQLAIRQNYVPDAVISEILDKQDKGENFPTKPGSEATSRKRKRTNGGDGPGYSLDHDTDDDDDGIERDPKSVRSIRSRLATDEYVAFTSSSEYKLLGRSLIGQDFPYIPKSDIRSLLKENKSSVLEAYTAIDENLRKQNAVRPWKDKKTKTRKKDEYRQDMLPNLDMNMYRPVERAALAELAAARELRAVKDAKVAAEAEERDNFHRAQRHGHTAECGICFEECALNRMIQCESETKHRFCRACMRSHTESQIGLAKYEITCMSIDGCSAGFSQAQRALFLDKKLTVALDRIEQEAVLRMAGIENLETCPFCPYAAEYPPVEEDKEFRCDNPRCQRVSCRLCRRETHIPKSCSEADADRGLDARHVLEEAMSEALIRRCNQCQNPFVKHDGCNKVRCTKCGALQCDVCRKTIKDYSHFNDTRRGGKSGRCPLFDKSEERHEIEVSKVEKEMKKKVVEANPDVNEQALRIPQLQEAQKREKERNNPYPIPPRVPPRVPPPRVIPPRVIPPDVVPPRFHPVVPHAIPHGFPHGVPHFVGFSQPAPKPAPVIPAMAQGGMVDGVMGRQAMARSTPKAPVYVRPNDLLLQHQNRTGHNNQMAPAPSVHRTAQPNQAPRPIGRGDEQVKAARGMVQKAKRHTERPAGPGQRGSQQQNLYPVAAEPMPFQMNFPFHPGPGGRRPPNGVAPPIHHTPNVNHLDFFPPYPDFRDDFNFIP